MVLDVIIVGSGGEYRWFSRCKSFNEALYVGKGATWRAPSIVGLRRKTGAGLANVSCLEAACVIQGWTRHWSIFSRSSGSTTSMLSIKSTNYKLAYIEKLSVEYYN